MEPKTEIKLILEDGQTFTGYSFGYPKNVSGEVVFNTAMTGYPESLTDASYKGQILVSTFPLIGNYGVPEYCEENGLLKYFESEKIQISGLVISDYSHKYSHWNADKSLGKWLYEHQIPAIYGIDTRQLTKILREKGTMPGKFVAENVPDKDMSFYNPHTDNLVDKVSISEKKIYGNGRYKVLLIDCGVKYNIIRCLLRRDTTVIRVPWDYDYHKEDFNGLFISNGPGDPKMCSHTIKNIEKSLQSDKPIFGICLGSQLTALAAGADTYKLKYGHRSHNQPVRRTGSDTCFITSQNHGFAVNPDTLPDDWQPFFVNLNDNTCEGIRHRRKPFFCTQFHPEASGGPTDTEYLFDEFIELMAT